MVVGYTQKTWRKSVVNDDEAFEYTNNLFYSLTFVGQAIGDETVIVYMVGSLRG